MKDEKDLFSLVTFAIKDIIIEQAQVFELWDDREQELLRLISEEADAFDDLTTGSFQHICSERGRQLFEETIPITIIADCSGLVLKEVFDLGLSGRRKLIFLGIVRKGTEFGIQ